MQRLGLEADLELADKEDWVGIGILERQMEILDADILLLEEETYRDDETFTVDLEKDL